VTHNSQKRKAEDVEDSPSKRTRSGNRESKGGGSKKRKLEDQEESPSKRTRLDHEQPVPKQARGRESVRMKEFPAGNVVTSASRISFLHSLCNIPKFSSLVDLVPALVSQFC